MWGPSLKSVKGKWIRLVDSPWTKASGPRPICPATCHTKASLEIIYYLFRVLEEPIIIKLPHKEFIISKLVIVQNLVVLQFSIEPTF